LCLGNTCTPSYAVGVQRFFVINTSPNNSIETITVYNHSFVIRACIDLTLELFLKPLLEG
jgi:hypothetical protein